MEKTILQEYVDACELIRETEEDIRKLKRKKQTVIQTNVKGSNPDFPYQEQHFRIQGTTFTYAEDGQLRVEERLLEERKAGAEVIKHQVEQWMLTIPVRMQRIIRFRFFEKMSWDDVAVRMGGRATEASVKMEFQRFIQEK